jgi:CRISPR/Cas system CSM-associated protein Csm2 small subunit
LAEKVNMKPKCYHNLIERSGNWICRFCPETVNLKTKAEEKLIKEALTLHKFLHEHDGPTSWTFKFYKAADKVIEERKKK